MLGSLFLIKLQAFQSKACKKETLAQVFRSEFCEISKNTFFTEHLLATASESPLWTVFFFFFFFEFTNVLIEKHTKIKEMSITSAKLSYQY